MNMLDMDVNNPPWTPYAKHENTLHIGSYCLTKHVPYRVVSYHGYVRIDSIQNIFQNGGKPRLK